MNFDKAKDVIWPYKELITRMGNKAHTTAHKPSTGNLKSRKFCQDRLADYKGIISCLGSPLPTQAPPAKSQPRSAQRNGVYVISPWNIINKNLPDGADLLKAGLAVTLTSANGDFELCYEAAKYMKKGVKTLRSLSYPVNKLINRAYGEGNKLLVGDDWLKLEKFRSGDRSDTGKQLLTAVLTLRREDRPGTPTTARTRVSGLLHIASLFFNV